jgi:DNA helicase-2/ATP-dependent DNA helicase PcrA
LAALQPDPVGFGAWLHSTLSNGSAADGVTLATVHRVKGQEWPVVVVHHAADDQFPHRLATDIEEERRLFHVAITRASQEVTVVAGDHPSPFVLDCSTEPSARPPARATRAPQPARATPAAPNAADTALFERLREWRRQAAAGKPAFTVFTDDTLRAIAAANPTSLDGLRRIKGVGPAKLEQYGAAVLAVLSRGT